MNDHVFLARSFFKIHWLWNLNTFNKNIKQHSSLIYMLQLPDYNDYITLYPGNVTLSKGLV